jgi:hypothetical protein
VGKSNRLSISVKGLTYHRLKAWCRARGVAISGKIEEWAEARLRSQAPTRRVRLYVAELGHGDLRFLVAPDLETATEMIQAKHDAVVPRLVDASDGSKITSWHYGLLTPAEAAEILGEKKVSEQLDSS